MEKTPADLKAEALRASVYDLFDACYEALGVLKGLESDWEMLTDGQHGAFPGGKTVKFLHRVIEKAKG